MRSDIAVGNKSKSMKARLNVQMKYTKTMRVQRLLFHVELEMKN